MDLREFTERYWAVEAKEAQLMRADVESTPVNVPPPEQTVIASSEERPDIAEQSDPDVAELETLAAPQQWDGGESEYVAAPGAAPQEPLELATAPDTPGGGGEAPRVESMPNDDKEDVSAPGMQWEEPGEVEHAALWTEPLSFATGESFRTDGKPAQGPPERMGGEAYTFADSSTLSMEQVSDAENPEMQVGEMPEVGDPSSLPEGASWSTEEIQSRVVSDLVKTAVPAMVDTVAQMSMALRDEMKQQFELLDRRSVL